MITQFIAKNKVIFTLLVIYEMLTTIMVYYIIIDNTLLIRFVILAVVTFHFFMIYLYFKRGWKNFYFSQFSRWSFIVFSNLFYNYNFKANLEEISRYNKVIKVPKQFKNSINLKDFNIKLKRKKWKWKRKGLNFKLKGWKKVYVSKKKISYDLWDYSFEYRKDQTIFFHIFLLNFEKISFCYLIIPPSINIDDLINIDVKFPLHYASKVPLNVSILKKFVNYSDTIMQFKYNEPYLFDHSRIMSFKDIDQTRTDEIDNIIRDMYLITKLKSIEGYNKYSILFESPILRNSKSSFEIEYYQHAFFPLERFRSITFKYSSESKFINDLTRWFRRCFIFHIQRQDNFLRIFISFLYWVEDNFKNLNDNNIRTLRSKINSIKEVIEINYESEFEYYNILNMELRNDYVDGADNVGINPFKEHLELVRFLKISLDYFIIKSIDYFQNNQQVHILLKEIREIRKRLERVEYDEIKIINIDKIIELIFSEFNKMSETTISDKDINNIYQMDDLQIRKSLAEILKNNTNLSNYARNLLSFEAKKPHTAFEISDFEFPLNYENNTYFICFVIKSGKEIRSDSISIDKVWYQIYRPFQELKNAIVIFLTAKKPSEVLKNWIKKHNSDNPSQQIVIIEGENFAKLFKIYKII